MEQKLCDQEENSSKETAKKFLALLIVPSSIVFGALSCVLFFAIELAPLFLLAYLLCDINPYETYSWYSGIWHGLCAVPNWIMSWLNTDVLCKAHYYTTGYNICWWVAFLHPLILLIPSIIGAIFEIIAEALGVNS